MKITMNTNEVSMCDNCSNCDICKYKEEAQDREKQLSEFYRGAWTQYLEIKMSCKYKRYETNRLTYTNYSNINTSTPPLRFDDSSTCNTVE